MKYLRILLFALTLLSFGLRMAFRSDDTNGASAVSKSDLEQVQEQANREYEDSLKSKPVTPDPVDSLKSQSAAAARAAAPPEGR